MSWIWAAEYAAQILPEKYSKTDSQKESPFSAAHWKIPLRCRTTHNVELSTTKPIRYTQCRPNVNSDQSAFTKVYIECNFFCFVCMAITQGGLSAFHPLFVIIRALRRTNHQTPHSLSRPDPIHHQPTNRLPEPASHRCPQQRKTDQAKNTPTGSPPPITTDFRAPSVGTVRTRKITTYSCPSLEAGFGSDFCKVFLPE